MTIEKEFDTREAVIEEIARLCNNSKGSIQVLRNKLDFYYSTEFADHTALNFLIRFVSAELGKLYRESEDAQKMANTAILPISNRQLAEEMRPELTIIAQLNILDDAIDMQAVRQLKEIGNKVFRSLTFLEWSKEDLCNASKTFNQQLQRYKEENRNILCRYEEDLVNGLEDLKSLRRQFADNKGVQAWLNSNRDEGDTIRKMIDEHCTEKELPTLYDFIAKEELTGKHKREEKSTRVFHMERDSQYIEQLHIHNK